MNCETSTIRVLSRGSKSLLLTLPKIRKGQTGPPRRRLGHLNIRSDIYTVFLDTQLGAKLMKIFFEVSFHDGVGQLGFTTTGTKFSDGNT